MDNNHLISAPPNSTMQWNGVEWTPVSLTVLGSYAISVSGSDMLKTASISWKTGLVCVNGVVGLTVCQIRHEIPLDEQSPFDHPVKAWKSIITFVQDIVVTYVHARHADQLLVQQPKLTLDLITPIPIHYYGPRGAQPSDEYVEQNPNVIIKAGADSFITKVDEASYSFCGTSISLFLFANVRANYFSQDGEGYGTEYWDQGSYSWVYLPENSFPFEMDYVLRLCNFVSDPISLAALSYTIGGIKISWVSSGAVILTASLSYDGGSTWTAFLSLVNGFPIASVSQLLDLTDVQIKIKAEFSATVAPSTDALPTLTSYTIEAVHSHAETHASGNIDEIMVNSSTEPSVPFAGMIWRDPT
jgi:hypothetical protein